MKRSVLATLAAIVIASGDVSTASDDVRPGDAPAVTPAAMVDGRGRVIGPLVAPQGTAKVAAAQAALWRSPWGSIKVQFRASGPVAAAEFWHLASPSLHFTTVDCTGPAYVTEADLSSFVPGFSRAFVADDVAGTHASPGPAIGTVYVVAGAAETVTPRGVRGPLGLSCFAISGTPAPMFAVRAVGRFSDYFAGPYLVK